MADAHQSENECLSRIDHLVSQLKFEVVEMQAAEEACKNSESVASLERDRAEDFRPQQHLLRPKIKPGWN